MLKHVDAGTLSIAYEEIGPPNGTAVMLLHGFPYDVRAYDEVTPLLVAKGCRVVTPYLRGYGPTKFLSTENLRGQTTKDHDVLIQFNIFLSGLTPKSALTC